MEWKERKKERKEARKKENSYKLHWIYYIEISQKTSKSNGDEKKNKTADMQALALIMRLLH